MYIRLQSWNEGYFSWVKSQNLCTKAFAMGNCSLKGVADTAKGFNFIRIMTDTGEILKLKGPKLVGQVLVDFPGYKICGKGRISPSLLDHEELVGGKCYYLLPVADGENAQLPTKDSPPADEKDQNAADGEMALCKDSPQQPIKNSFLEDEEEPVRTSCAAVLDLVTSLANGPALEVLPPPQKGVWKVKLAITPKQLEEILSEEVNTEALIEQMRMAAASSASVTPRRSKISWGLIWKPILNNVFKAPIESEDEVHPVSFFNSPIKGC